MTDAANDFLLSSKTTSASFLNIGDAVTGIIARQPEKQQSRNFETQEPEFWPDGNPKWQVKVVLQTEERDPADPDDNGERAIYVKGGMRSAVAEAIKQVGAAGLEVGGKLQVQYVGNGQITRRGGQPPKLYRAQYRPPAMAVPIEPQPAVQPQPAAVAAQPTPVNGPTQQPAAAPTAPLPPLPEIPF